MSKVYQQSKEVMYQKFKSSEKGLSKEGARNLLEAHGYNELVAGERKGIVKVFLEQFKDYLVIILIVAAVISGFLGDLKSAFVIFLVITMNAILGTIQHTKAEKSLNSLKQLSAPKIASLLKDTKEHKTPL